MNKLISCLSVVFAWIFLVLLSHTIYITRPPIITNISPTEVSCTNDPRDITIQITTNEEALCKTVYVEEEKSFSTTDGINHNLTPYDCGKSSTYTVRCYERSPE